MTLRSLTGLVATGAPAVEPAPNPAAWLPELAWAELNALSTLPAFTELSDNIAATPGRWRHVYDAADPAEEPFPGKSFEQLTSMQRLLVGAFFDDARWPTRAEHGAETALARQPEHFAAHVQRRSA
jgi:hypothetical protein